MPNPDEFSTYIADLLHGTYDCVDRISQREMRNDSPSLDLMDEYLLLRDYLDFIKRVCKGQ